MTIASVKELLVDLVYGILGFAFAAGVLFGILILLSLPFILSKFLGSFGFLLGYIPLSLICFILLGKDIRNS